MATRDKDPRANRGKRTIERLNGRYSHLFKDKKMATLKLDNRAVRYRRALTRFAGVSRTEKHARDHCDNVNRIL